MHTQSFSAIADKIIVRVTSGHWFYCAPFLRYCHHFQYMWLPLASPVLHSVMTLPS